MPERSAEFDHFLEAQDPVYREVLRELSAGLKRTHWMWFIFPQVKGLGTSGMSLRFALDSVAQAERYLAHERLGKRLVECARIVWQVQGKTAEEIFGPIDALKYRSSLTLFSLCRPPVEIFARSLEKYFSGQADERTLQLLGSMT